MHDEEEVKYWLALRLIGDLTNGEIRSLIERFSSPREVFSASKADLREILKNKVEKADEIANFKNWGEAEREWERLKCHEARIVTFRDPDFPGLLTNIDNYPPFLYVKGRLDRGDINIAIVGSRRASGYGLIAAENFARGLALAGLTVVSGLARGIDAAAHRGALSARGRTIAVLGSGLDIIYPPENRALYSSISQSGALVTEYPFGTPPRAKNFPFRNRLISGMSWGVVVVEAGEKSGSLITARLAAEQGRAVFAVPGDINSPLSRGVHRLLKEGATLVEGVSDILEEIRPQLGSPREMRDGEEKSEINVVGAEANILNLIGSKPVHGDLLIEQAGLPPGEVMSILLTLEFKGLVQQLPGKYYRRMG